eukprot:982727_1
MFHGHPVHSRSVSLFRRHLLKKSFLSVSYRSFCSTPKLPSSAFLDPIVKIHCVTSGADHQLPWQNQQPRQVTGSGFAIANERILTNAHVVSDQKFVTVTKHGSSQHFPAEVSAVGHDCDLAMLTVRDTTFWSGIWPLELGGIPEIQDSVRVVGYPTGGKTVSVTSGVVSRVEMIHYTHAASRLLGIQIDAAINAGNSGGPALKGDKVVGVAFQNLENAENVGYIIPTDVVEHFLADIEKRGKYVGFCSLGINFQFMTDTKAIHKFFKLSTDRTGILVTKVRPSTPAFGLLRLHDVILSIDGRTVDNDGTVEFRHRERVSMEWLVAHKADGDTIKVVVWRDREELTLSIKVRPPSHLVQIELYDQAPSYYTICGLVFVPLTQPFLHTWGEEWFNSSPRKLCEVAMRGDTSTNERKEVVILSQVLDDKANMGAGSVVNSEVVKVNGNSICSLAHLREFVEKAIRDKEELLCFEMEDQRLVVIETKDSDAVTERILKRNRIHTRASANLESIVDHESDEESTEPVVRKK